MVALTDKNVLEIARGFIKFPGSQICKHNIVLTMLDHLERAGFPLSRELVKAVADVDDEQAITLLDKEIGNATIQ